jgi:hypothetical protein
MLIRLFMKLMDQAGAGGAAGGGGAAAGAAAGGGGAAGAAAGGAGGAAAAGGAAGAASGSALGGAAGAGAASGAEWAPEKYQVKKADGTLDVEATARKVAGGYTELDKRMKDVGLPPESADKYDIKVSDAVKPTVDELLQDPTTKQFLKDAHAKGLTNSQVSFVLEQYAKTAQALAEGGLEIGREECTAELQKTWKTQADYDKNVGAGYRAAVAFASSVGVKFEQIEQAGLANNPLFIRIMAAVGAEMGEDVPPIDAGQGGGGDAKSFEEQTRALRDELAKLDLHDPKRPEIQKKLDGLYARKYPSRQPMLQSRSV